MDNDTMLMMMAAGRQPPQRERRGCGCSGCMPPLGVILILIGIWFPWELLIK
jgi:hypothetical protein